jgi:hypothetical protein
MTNNRLLTEKETDKLIGTITSERYLARHCTYQEEKLLIEAQDLKTAPIVREETAREIFQEIEKASDYTFSHNGKMFILTPWLLNDIKSRHLTTKGV